MANWLDHSSIVGHWGSYGDRLLNPLSWATNGKWTDWTSNVLPEKVNSGLSHVMQPFDWVDQTVNPVRKIPIVNRAADIIKAKPGDSLALAAAAFFGGEAALGGAGGAGAGAGGGAAEGLGAAGADGVGGGLGTASGFGGVGTDAGATGWGSLGADAGDAIDAGGGWSPATGFVDSTPTTMSGFGGVGTDPSVSTLDGSSIDPALGSDDIDAGGGWNPGSSNNSSMNYKLMGKMLNAFNQQQQKNAQAQQRALVPQMSQNGLLPTTSTYHGGQFINPNT